MQRFLGLCCLLGLLAGCSDHSPDCLNWREARGSFTDLGASSGTQAGLRVLRNTAEIDEHLSNRQTRKYMKELKTFTADGLEGDEQRFMILGKAAPSTSTQLSVSVKASEANRIAITYTMEQKGIGLQVIGQPFWIGAFPKDCPVNFVAK